MMTTKDEIIEMALAAWSKTSERVPFRGWFEDRAEWFEAFAKLVEERTAAKEREWWKEHIKKDIDTAKKEEREACAKLVEHPFFGDQGKECADAIRARGEA